jgi:hypothetical protein
MLNISRQQAFLLLVFLIFVVLVFAAALVWMWLSFSSPLLA